MKRSWFASPYLLWMAMFIFIPILLIVYYSLTIRTPDGVTFTLEHFQRFWEPVYVRVLLRSIRLALISTAICLLLGYPMAMILAEKQVNQRNFLILLFIIPMWMNLLLRTYAWMTLLGRTGLINQLFTLIGLPTVEVLYTSGAVVLGMVYNFLPFMVLPIYTVLIKIDKTLIEAGEDLGGNSFTIFRKIIFPLSMPGVVSGIVMVFMPAVTTFVIPRLLGGGHFTLIGNLIEQQFLYVGDWGFGSSLSIVMMVFILISIKLLSTYDHKREGGGLW